MRITGHVQYAQKTRPCCDKCGQALPAEGLTFDREHRSVSRGSITITLQQRQFDVLQAIYDNRPHVVPKDRIFNKVWGFDSEISPDVIDVHLCKMRPLINGLGVELRTIFNSGVQYRSV